MTSSTLGTGRASEGQTERRPTCPLCNGVLIPLRESYRCSRCQFMLCKECEGGPFEELPERD